MICSPCLQVSSVQVRGAYLHRTATARNSYVLDILHSVDTPNPANYRLLTNVRFSWDFQLTGGHSLLHKHDSLYEPAMRVRHLYTHTRRLILSFGFLCGWDTKNQVLKPFNRNWMLQVIRCAESNVAQETQRTSPIRSPPQTASSTSSSSERLFATFRNK